MNQTLRMVVGSRNKGKIRELNALLSQYLPGVELLSLDEAGITETVEETGTTFAENALIKARAAASTGLIGLADDSGLSVAALDGEPGVFSARYAEINGFGQGHSDADNNALLLSRMEGKEDRSCSFICDMACVFPDDPDHPILVEGVCEGTLLDRAQGEGGFGYDPLFWYPALEKTFAQLSEEEKNAVSHRGCAVRALALALTRYLEKGKVEQ